jgi:hypothetical protein
VIAVPSEALRSLCRFCDAVSRRASRDLMGPVLIASLNRNWVGHSELGRLVFQPTLVKYTVELGADLLAVCDARRAWCSSSKAARISDHVG